MLVFRGLFKNNRSTMNKSYLLSLLTIILSANLSAHSGRTDSNGGHYDRSTGLYHYHNRGNAKTSPAKAIPAKATTTPAKASPAKAKASPAKAKASPAKATASPAKVKISPAELKTSLVKVKSGS